jgi:hypothetical protein
MKWENLSRQELQKQKRLQNDNNAKDGSNMVVERVVIIT